MKEKKQKVGIHVTQENTIERDELVTLLATELNKNPKDGRKVCYFLDDHEDGSTVTDWISTGSSLLDVAISNRPNGGLPVGRMVELSGLEGCVTEDTIIKVIVFTDTRVDSLTEMRIGDVLLCISNGERLMVSAKDSSLQDTFVEITDFIEKGLKDTYQVTLDNGYSINVTSNHKFFTTRNWIETKDISIETDTIYCDDSEFHKIVSIVGIGKRRIVDIVVKSDAHSYFGNGMLNHNSGKSLMSAHIVADTQRQGGVAVVIDTETSAAPEFWKSLGVDLKNLPYIQCETVEDIFAKIEDMIAIVRKSNKNKILTIIVDSVAAASTKEEMESDHGKTGYATGKSIIVSKAMRKITNMIGNQRILLVFTNQLRMNMNAGPFGEKYCVDPLTTKIKIRYKV